MLILAFGFQQSLNGYPVSAKADPEILVEFFWQEGLQELDQFFPGVAYFCKKLGERILFVFLDQNGVVGLPIRVTMFVESW